MSTKFYVLLILAYSLLLPLTGSAQSKCIDIFSLNSSAQQSAPRTEVRVYTNTFFSHLEPVVQGYINKTERILRKFTVPKKANIKVNDVAPAGLTAQEFGCGMFNATSRDIFINKKTYGDLSPHGREFLEGIIQHEFGHYIFLMNMGRHSAQWKKWVERMNNRFMAEIADLLMFFSMGAPEVQVEISAPYQEVFADLVSILTLNKPNAMMDNLEIYTGNSTNRNFTDLSPESRAKEQKKLQEVADKVAARGFDKPFFDMKWNEKEEHGMLGPVRVYLWETYFSKDKNKGREDEILLAVFDIMGREIVARSEDPALITLSPEIVNSRLLNALHLGLSQYQ